MPRPKREGAPEPKKRSRLGCWNCKSRKIKCGEEKPRCTNCARSGEECDYSVRLIWGGRTGRQASSAGPTSPPTAGDRRGSGQSSPPGSGAFSIGEASPRAAPGEPGVFMTFSLENRQEGLSGQRPVPEWSGPPEVEAYDEYTDYSGGSPDDSSTASYSNEPATGFYEGAFNAAASSVFDVAPSLFQHPSSFIRHQADAPPEMASPQITLPITPETPGSFEPASHHEQSLLPAPAMALLGLHTPYETSYGFDLGCRDEDIGKNDDVNAIASLSRVRAMDFGTTVPGYAELRAGNDMAFEKGGYYAKPVAIMISTLFEPLPRILLENPMNLLYFHHFINHTARILVPHDCEQNPFRSVLPEMAIRDETVMNLLLSFSAAHRARLLKHGEPSTRIATWMKDVFPQLHASLATSRNSDVEVSNNVLAPVIMLASLAIISPNTFEVPVSWREHLSIARSLILVRGHGRQAMSVTMHRDDRVSYFLSRWFAYLDVLGSLSGNKSDQPIPSSYWSPEKESADEAASIDCLMGFTNRALGILARISELAQSCQDGRFDSDGNLRSQWQPTPEVFEEAVKVYNQLVEGLSCERTSLNCNHLSATTTQEQSARDGHEMFLTNQMFHWAGLIHLQRRVFGHPAEDGLTQEAVEQIVKMLTEVRRGSPAEACLLFPMFTAGCNSLQYEQRKMIRDRLTLVEGFGIAQVNKARAIMEAVWRTGKPWESLVDGEFLG